MTTTITRTFTDNCITPPYNVGDLALYLNREDLNRLPIKKTIPCYSKDMVTLYIETGCMSVTTNGVTHLLKEKDICVIGAGCVHFLESYKDQDCIFYCGIANESLFSASEGIIRKYLNPIFHSPRPKIGIVPAGSEYNEQLVRIFRDIYDCLTDQPPAYDLIVVAKFYEYLAFLSTALEKPTSQFDAIDSKEGKALRNMLAFIQENYQSKISTDQLCEVGHISRNQCFRLFTSFTGETPGNYILNYRLNMARTMLMESDQSISQIAMSCGFAQQSHFTHHFSNRFGITPLRFRKNRE